MSIEHRARGRRAGARGSLAQGGGSLPGDPLRSRTNDWSIEEASSTASSSVSAAITLIAGHEHGAGRQRSEEAGTVADTGSAPHRGDRARSARRRHRAGRSIAASCAPNRLEPRIHISGFAPRPGVACIGRRGSPAKCSCSSTTSDGNALSSLIDILMQRAHHALVRTRCAAETEIDPPGNRASSAPNCSAITSGLWFGGVDPARTDAGCALVASPTVRQHDPTARPQQCLPSRDAQGHPEAVVAQVVPPSRAVAAGIGERLRAPCRLRAPAPGSSTAELQVGKGCHRADSGAAGRRGCTVGMTRELARSGPPPRRRGFRELSERAASDRFPRFARRRLARAPTHGDPPRPPARSRRRRADRARLQPGRHLDIALRPLQILAAPRQRGREPTSLRDPPAPAGARARSAPLASDRRPSATSARDRLCQLHRARRHRQRSGRWRRATESALSSHTSAVRARPPASERHQPPPAARQRRWHRQPELVLRFPQRQPPHRGNRPAPAAIAEALRCRTPREVGCSPRLASPPAARGPRRCPVHQILVALSKAQRVARQLGCGGWRGRCGKSLAAPVGEVAPGTGGGTSVARLAARDRQRRRVRKAAGLGPT